MSESTRHGHGNLGASKESWYGIIASKESQEPEFLQRELDEGQVTLYIFAPPERGESFITFRGLRPEWRVRAYSAHSLIPLIEKAIASGIGIKYVSINPPDSQHKLTTDSVTIPIEDFLASLNDLRS